METQCLAGFAIIHFIPILGSMDVDIPTASPPQLMCFPRLSSRVDAHPSKARLCLCLCMKNTLQGGHPATSPFRLMTPCPSSLSHPLSSPLLCSRAPSSPLSLPLLPLHCCPARTSSSWWRATCCSSGRWWRPRRGPPSPPARWMHGSHCCAW